VEITPATEGRFKWITTRNLQFIPKERLIRSSNYEVKIKAGLVSLDGLTVAAATNSFVTRKLRYVNLTQDTIIYDQPLSIYFNQPVDLEKTKGEIVLKDETTGREMPFIAEYLKKKNDKSDENIQDNAVGIKQPTGFFAKVRHFFTKPFSKNVASLNPLELIKKESDQLDKSVIQIYNQKDQFGREKLWDFSHNYSLTIRKAFPLEGNIILDESRQTNASVTGIIR